MNISEFIKKYRKDHKMTMQEFADRSGLSKGYISQLENDYRFRKDGAHIIPSLPTYVSLAGAMGMDVNDLLKAVNSEISLTGKDIVEIQNNSIQIPLYSPICCGNGGFNDDNIIDYITLPSDMLNPRGDYFAQRAAGDSMIGEGIKPGDLLVFEKTGHCENGQIGCFCIDDNDAVCKKYRVTENNQIMLLPANDKYDPMIIDVENEHFRCIGVLAYSVHSYK
jgi:repressor LexA